MTDLPDSELEAMRQASMKDEWLGPSDTRRLIMEIRAQRARNAELEKWQNETYDAALKQSEDERDAVINRLENALVIGAENRARADRLAKALQGILDDDDASTSLALQRQRWEGRMKAAKDALRKCEEETK